MEGPSLGKRRCLGVVAEVFGVLQAVAAPLEELLRPLPPAGAAPSCGFVSPGLAFEATQVLESMHDVVSGPLDCGGVERSVSSTAAWVPLSVIALWG